MSLPLQYIKSIYCQLAGNYTVLWYYNKFTYDDDIGVMMNPLYPFLKDWLPPKVLKLSKNIFKRGVVWKGDYKSWEAANKYSSGYDDSIILEKVKSAIQKINNGEAVFERDSVLFDKIEYSWPILACLMWIAASNRGSLNVVDFGGSLGSTYYQNKRFLEGLGENVRWNIVEQKHFIDIGKEYFENERLKYYYDIESCFEVTSPNTILLSSVIQYLEKPFEMLEKIKYIGFEYIIFDRTGFINRAKDRLTVQTVPPSIYACSYPCWFFNKKKFYSFFEDKYDMVASFDSLDAANISAQFEGSILRIKK